MTVNSVAQEFNQKAGNYESNRLSAWYIAHAELLLEIVPKPNSGYVFDIGCGTGYFLRQFLKKYPNTKGIGIDVSSGMIQQAVNYASQENITNVEFICADWETFGLNNNHLPKAEIVICANTYHYFSNPLASLAKIFDSMGRGSLYIVERDKSSSILTYLWDYAHRHFIKDKVVFYDQGMILKNLNIAGFQDAKVLQKAKKYFWKGKLYTDIVFIKGQRGI